MKIIFNIMIFLTVIILFNSNAFGKAKLDCSQYTTKTWSGLMDKMRCKKGLPPRKNFFGSIKFESKSQKKLETCPT